MSDPNRPTLPYTSLKDALVHPAPLGKRVIALNKGGTLGFTIVNKDFLNQFDAWAEYPTIPDSVKRRQSNPKNLFGDKNEKPSPDGFSLISLSPAHLTQPGM